MYNKTIQVKNISDQEIINACNSYHQSGCEHNLRPDIVLSKKYPIKVIFRKMEKMVEKNILDYGMWIWGAWVIKNDSIFDPSSPGDGKG